MKMITGGKNYLGRRYSVFLIGLFICSFGVACTNITGSGNPLHIVADIYGAVFR